jgi:hypothetical protein
MRDIQKTGFYLSQPPGGAMPIHVTALVFIKRAIFNINFVLCTRGEDTLAHLYRGFVCVQLLPYYILYIAQQPTKWHAWPLHTFYLE